MNHGYPLDMVAYSIGMIPLIKFLKSTYPNVTQPFYAYNTGALGTLDHLEKCFKALKRNGWAQGYFPNPTKSILVMHPQNLKAGDIFG